jgi:ABC-type lipoprotein release transport system permease subunit
MMTIPGIAGYNASNRGLATGSGLTFRQGHGSTESDNMGSIQGVNDSSLLSDFSNHRFSLTLGRHITPEDQNVVMISETLARENNLIIGDTVALRPAEIGINDENMFENTMDDSGPSIEAKIIGIFAEEEVQFGAAWSPAAGIVSNQLFSDHGLMTSLGLANPGQYEAVTFRVSDPSELPRIVDKISEIEDMDRDSFLMQHNDGDYMRISGDLQTVQNLILVLLIAIGIISAIILTLILILRMRGRLHEVGILLSVGIGKKQIWGGFLLEIIIIAIPSFIVSYVSSSIMVPTLNRGLLADLPSLADFGQQQFQTMSLGMYGLVYLLILLVVLSTAYLSTLLTIRLKPKQLLSKMS